MSKTTGSGYLSQGFDDSYVNPRGIPRAIFIDNVEQYVSSKVEDITNVEPIQRVLQDQHSKYAMMEVRLVNNRQNLKQKVPEIEKTLKAVRLLKEKYEADETVKTHYQLSDNIYVKAELKKNDKVALWLGANVMVEYSFDEAIKLLESSLESATNGLEQTYEDYAFLKDQKTTTEVNMSRVHNFGVKKRQELKNKK
ncbi:hypothetical protein AKO1_010915 [Acrasis kona]|uniref:Prefoldin subunit 3 n=1 Tax=Acrasis kona TaxID=1008807 RepID=A0AAW2YTD2_9EUKA